MSESNALIDPQVDVLARHLADEGYTPEHLDQAVHDAASERATFINKKGLYEQVKFLIRGSDNSFKLGDVITAARRAKRDAEHYQGDEEG